MKKIIFIAVTVLVLVFSVSVVPVRTNAQTAADLQAQISALLAQIAALQNQLANTTSGQNNAVPVNTTPYCVSLTSTNLVYRSRDTNTGGQVSQLQRFLQVQGHLNAQPSGYFGEATFAAVKAFQRAHDLSATGGVNSATRAKIKALTCGEVIDTPVTPVVSGGAQSQVASINISSPRGGDVWYQGNSYTVSWTPFTGNFTHYQLWLSNRFASGSWSGAPVSYLVPRGQATSVTINSSDLNDSLVEGWLRNAGGHSEQAVREGFYYKVSAHNASPSGLLLNKEGLVVAEGTSGTFSILKQSPTTNTENPFVTVLTQNTNQTISYTQPVTIRWTTNVLGRAYVYFNRLDGGMCFLGEVDAAQGSYTLIPQSITCQTQRQLSDPFNQYRVKLMVSRLGETSHVGTVQDWGDGIVTISNIPSANVPQPPTPPASNFNVTFPTSGATLAQGSSQTVRWTGTLPGALPGTSYSVYLVAPTTPAANIYVTSVSPLQGSFNWTVPTDVNALSGYKLKFVGNGSSDGFSSTFTISAGANNTTPPPPPPVNPPVTPPTPPTPPPTAPPAPAPLNPAPTSWSPLRITAPAANATLTKGTGLQIIWSLTTGDNSCVNSNNECGQNYTVALVSPSLGVTRVLTTTATGISGALSATVPTDIANGTDYRIRITGYSGSGYSNIVTYSEPFKIQ